MFGEKLKRERILKGYTLTELSNKVNNIVTKQAISQYEKEVKNPSSTVLIELAKALGKPIEYFFMSDDFIVEKLEFIYLPKVNKKTKVYIEEVIKTYALNINKVCLDVEDIDREIKLIPIDLEEKIEGACGQYYIKDRGYTFILVNINKALINLNLI